MEPSKECHILFQYIHISNLLPERAQAFSVFYAKACALAEYYKITGRNVREEEERGGGGGGVSFILVTERGEAHLGVSNKRL